jgi:hypothetical protein
MSPFSAFVIECKGLILMTDWLGLSRELDGK